MPWHPPCALHNLIVIRSFLYSETNLQNSQLVFFTRCFPSGCAVFKVLPGIFRSLKTIHGRRTYSQSGRPVAGLFQPLYSRGSTWNEPPASAFGSLPRKEVIQPHLPIRLPCYDFTPVIDLTLGCWLLAVTSQLSGAINSHGVTGGVYKARERIHRGMLIRDY